MRDWALDGLATALLGARLFYAAANAAIFLAALLTWKAVT